MLIPLVSGYCSAATLYVWESSPNPSAPYTNWSMAAHNIQDAVDAAQTNDLVLVTNGIYRTGGRKVGHFGALTNRVAINKPMQVQSVNGPGATMIQGVNYWNGDFTMRCAYVWGEGALLSGFSMGYGSTETNGDPILDQSGGGVWCRNGGIVSNCYIFNCSANSQGGGAYGGTLVDCTLSSNTASNGGGVAQSTVRTCTLWGNSASSVFSQGGGAYMASLIRCTLTSNSALFQGGGASQSTLTSCLVSANSARQTGGGAYACNLFNCTVVGNKIEVLGGGVYGCTLYNCIVYYNSVVYPDLTSYPPDFAQSFFYNCCISAEPTIAFGGGSGNIIMEPGFVNYPAGDYHLRSGSPCIDAGIDLGLTNDLDGNPRPQDGNGDGVAVCDVGAYEYTFQPTKTLYVWLDSPAASPPYSNWISAARTIQEAVDFAKIGDTVIVTNSVYATGYGIIGSPYVVLFTNRVLINKAITMRSVNGPEVTTIVGAPDPSGGNGAGAIRCAYVGYGAVLSGFTLSNGHTTGFNGDITMMGGGGAYCQLTGTMTNCLVVNNSGYWGGGVVGGNLYNCTIMGNQADGYGGGSYYGSFNNCKIQDNYSFMSGAGGYGGSYYNCLVTGNHGDGIYGGGVYNCTVVSNSGSGICWVTASNSIVYYNSPDVCGPNTTTTFNCVTPIPYGGTGNLTNAPSFVNPTAGDFRLRYGSAGIDAGIDLTGTLSEDLDGIPRPLPSVIGGMPAFDIGAFEYDPASADSNSDGIPDWWTLRYNFDPNDPNTALRDPDGDGVSTYDEWVADTNPTNAASYFHITAVSKGPPMAVGFQSSSNRQYTLFYCTNLGVGNLPDLPWFPVNGQSNIHGNGRLQFLSDNDAICSQFYRVGVALPK